MVKNQTKRSKKYQSRAVNHQYDDEVCFCCIPILTGVKIIVYLIIVNTIVTLVKNSYIIARTAPSGPQEFSMEWVLYERYGKTYTYIDFICNLLTIFLCAILLYGLHIKDHRYFIAPSVYSALEIFCRMFLIGVWCFEAQSYLKGHNNDIPKNRRTHAVIVISSWILMAVVRCAFQIYFLWIIVQASRFIKRL
ncbi:hypothetical protein M3Y95_00863700 [Aphelenchoides besseyi]|nr:hypothetical protein M3Y95_00863700 [Aphelenchoides besseyi]